jgi:galactokinase
MLDLNQKETIALDSTTAVIEKGDFLRTALKVLRRFGCIPTQGYDIEIQGNIPINAGLSSSTALTIAWIHFLIEAFGTAKAITASWIAQRAYETEVLEQGSSGGSMDQYAIAVGKMIHLNTADNSFVRIAKPIGQLVVGVSGIAKDTFGTLAYLKDHALKAIAQVKKVFPEFEIAEAKSIDLHRYLNCVDYELKAVFTAAVINHSITKQAKIELDKSNPDPIVLGDLMNQHHEQLRLNLKISPPKINAMIEAVIEAGACGAKIVGSGGGGCIVALTNKNNTEELISAMKKAGAIDAFEVTQSNGSSVNTSA